MPGHFYLCAVQARPALPQNTKMGVHCLPSIMKESPMRMLSRCAGMLFAVYLLASAQAQASSIEVKAVRYPAWVENGDRKTPLQPGMQARASDLVATGEDARILFSLA